MGSDKNEFLRRKDSKTGKYYYLSTNSFFLLYIRIIPNFILRVLTTQKLLFI